MKTAEGTTLFVTPEYKDEWMKFWQRARYHKEYRNKYIQNSDKRKQYWRTAAADLGGHITKLERMAREFLQG